MQAERYSVFVPDNQLEEFKRVTYPRIDVRNQTALSAGFAVELRDALIQAGNEKRYGWYLQQFCMFEALRTSPSPRRIIWDADCVPLRPIEMFDQDDNATCMRAEEFHANYFALVKRWLGLNRVQTQPFIPKYPI